MRRHQQVLIPAEGARGHAPRLLATVSPVCPPRRSLLIGAVTAALIAGCSDLPSSLRIAPEAGPMAVARLVPKNGSTVRGMVSFTQRGDKVAIAGNFVELYSGTHSLYIHAVGNCGSPNAASAGPVWDVAGAAPGEKRTGDLPELTAGSEGRAELATSSASLSVGTGKPNDVIGHAVVVHAAVDPDPKPEFGVRNGWIACGVIERSQGFDFKKLF
ncbi:MAG TPA: superoxide dismutase family protein [Casimicrobiaceae bacterium]|nr:superoxide dismutase family protein [Casimicrobiaceae bacterium]